MTSNTDKLSLIAPLLVGRGIHFYYTDDTGQTTADGRFHSLEIDDVYPDSDPMVYIRATNVVHERWEGFPVYDAMLVSRREEDYAEFVFPASDLLSIDLVLRNQHDGLDRKDLVTITFDRKAGAFREHVLFFHHWEQKH